MAENEPKPDAAATPKGPSTLALALAVFASVMVGAAAIGVLIWQLASHGKLTMPVQAASQGALPAAKKTEAEAESHVQTLEPVLINLADPSGSAYLRVALALRVADDPKAKGKEAKSVPGADAAVRDTVLDVLGRQQSGVLLTPEGKTKLKAQLVGELKKRNPAAHIEDVYFTDFLVQR